MDELYPATLRLDSSHEISLEIAVPGNNRLKEKTCDYPPLKLHFKKKKVKKTLFRNQSELKMVVLCKNSRPYAQYLRMEYLIYQLFAIISDNSFKARWLDITYSDKEPSQNAFLIEQKKRMGKRLGLTQVHEGSIPRRS